MQPLTTWAQDLARTLTPSLGANAKLLEAAAWLHDIGYLPELAATGLHGLDGDRYGTGHLVTRFIRRATPLLLEAVGQVNARAASTTRKPTDGVAVG